MNGLESVAKRAEKVQDLAKRAKEPNTVSSVLFFSIYLNQMLLA